MKVIDTNAPIIVVLGLIDPKIIKTHKRTSLYEEVDFHALMRVIGNFESLVTIPNVWTELDNLLHNSIKHYTTFKYTEVVISCLKLSSKKYLPSLLGTQNIYFGHIGLTDSLLLELAKNA